MGEGLLPPLSRSSLLRRLRCPLPKRGEGKRGSRGVRADCFGWLTRGTANVWAHTAFSAPMGHLRHAISPCFWPPRSLGSAPNDGAGEPVSLKELGSWVP